MEYKLAYIGFGTVGQGLSEIILSHGDALKTAYGVEIKLVAIADQLKGSVYDPDGIDPADVLSYMREHGSIKDYKCRFSGWDSMRTIEESNADIVVEASYTNIDTGEPAVTHIRKAFESGKHVVTTNKGPMVKAYPELMAFAAKNNVFFGFEGTVLSGTPVFSLAKYCLPANEIREIKGILNGTTNYILGEMEKGLSYETALKQAQLAGYAEAQPDADVKGYDALAKVIILADVLMNEKLDIASIPCEGITGISGDDIAKALKEGCRYKLIGSIKREKGSITAKVGPQKLPLSNALAGISGAMNAITFVTEFLGETTIVGAGAGKIETGYALLKDILEIHRKISGDK